MQGMDVPTGAVNLFEVFFNKNFELNLILEHVSLDLWDFAKHLENFAKKYNSINYD